MATAQALAPVVITGKKKSDDDVTIVIDGRPLGGWTDVRITRGIERMPNDFELGMTEVYPSDTDAMVIKPGDPCQIKIGRDLVITGYVDRVMPSIAGRQHTIRVLGRGKCQDLVDCSAIWPHSQIAMSTVLEIAKKLAAPYGIEVTGVGDQGGPVPLYNIMIGETAWNVIECWARIRQLLAYELPDGNLRLLYTATEKGAATPFPFAASGFKEGVNVQQAHASWSADQRYSDYNAHRMSIDAFQDLGEGGNLIASFKDRGMRRFRQRDIIAEQNVGQGAENAKDRAQWEAARRFGRSGVVQILTDSWRDAAGALYAPGTTVPIDCPSIHKPASPSDLGWVISEVSYLKNENGTTASITAMVRDAFSPQPSLPPSLIAAEVNLLPDGLGRR